MKNHFQKDTVTDTPCPVRYTDSVCPARYGKGILAVVLLAVLLNGCAGNVKASEADTPGEAAELVMDSIRELDLETFNAHTDNYEGICRNFIGLPIEKEYKVFNELLGPRIFETKRYKERRRFAEKVVEELTWKIGKVHKEEGGRKASIEITLTNKDMAEAMDRYIMWIIEDTVEDTCLGAISLITDIPRIVNTCDDDLIRFIDETENTRTEEVTVTAYKEDGIWKLHLSDEFIHAFMGNMDSEE